MMLFKFGCRNPQNCLQRFNICVNLADDPHDKQLISQLINLIGNYLPIYNDIYLSLLFHSMVSSTKLLPQTSILSNTHPSIIYTLKFITTKYLYNSKKMSNIYYIVTSEVI